MRFKITYLSVFISCILSSNAQVLNLIGKNESNIVKEFLSGSTVSIRTDYILMTSDAEYGRNNQDFFSYSEGEAFLLDCGFFVVSPKLVEPWMDDSLYSIYKDDQMYTPAISTVYIKKANEHSYVTVTIDTMFTSAGLGFIKLKDTIDCRKISTVEVDSTHQIDWVYSVRIKNVDSVPEIDFKLFNTSGFNKSKFMSTVSTFGNQMDDESLRRDIFLFVQNFTDAGIEFKLAGYLDENDSIHFLEMITPEIDTSKIVNPSEAQEELILLQLRYVDGFTLSNKEFLINGALQFSDLDGNVRIDSLEGLTINGYEINLTKEQLTVYLKYDNGEFIPAKKYRLK